MHVIPYIFKNFSEFQHVCLPKLVNFDRLFFRIASFFHVAACAERISSISNYKAVQRLKNTWLYQIEF
jgi:hypothetical protein